MNFRMDQLLFGLSTGLDFVEGEVLGVTTNHGKRISVLAIEMGKYLGLDTEHLIGLAACAILHDNALTEHMLSMKPGMNQNLYTMLHCARGEENISGFPFPCDVRGFIRFHHEFADASGPFHLTTEKTPLGAQIIAITDNLDIKYNFAEMKPSSLAPLFAEIRQKRDVFFSAQAADALLAVLDEQLLEQLQDHAVDEAFQSRMPEWVVNSPASELMELSTVIARITDYKSPFTAKHSAQIANKAYWMASFYGFDEETKATLFIAASFHDIGKLVIPSKILDKPGKLSPEEFAIIKDHAYWSYLMLKEIEGFGEICRLAACHHRKINGTGYPELPPAYIQNDFFSRLIVCLDIYQAVREARPYHEGHSHRETMDIMWSMVARNEIDRQITQDIDQEMAQFIENDGDVPFPKKNRSAS